MIKLSIEKLHPHPDNPRKDLGDLSELAESIKERGVLQNLTVVPQSEDPDDMNFTVVIGHRRLAAAKLAGLTKVPCVIADMTPKEQVATMLLENIQRNDLTLYEQAQGFQMMLDLGATRKEIAEKTGLSATTVGHRVKMLDLDQEIIKEKGEQIKISDLIALEPIKDPKTKNKLLKSWGGNMEYRIQKAIKDEQEAEVLAELIPQLEALGAKKTEKYEHEIDCTEKRVYKLDKLGQTIKLFGDGQYVWANHWGGVCLYKLDLDATEKRNAEKKEQSERAKQEKALTQLFRNAAKLRKTFVADLYEIGQELDKDMLLGFLARKITSNNYRTSLAGKSDIQECFGLDEEQGLEGVPARYRVLAAIVLDYKYETFTDWGRKYKKNDELENLYAYLESMGYEMTDEERQLMDGTHELYEKGDEEQ